MTGATFGGGLVDANQGAKPLGLKPRAIGPVVENASEFPLFGLFGQKRRCAKGRLDLIAKI